MSTAAAAGPLVLRTAAVWGTNVLAVRELRTGESLRMGDKAGALLPKPDGSGVSDAPVRAVGSGWELDARGVTGGLLLLRGRREDPAHLARSGAPIPIVAGDHGVLQYGSFGVFFQFSMAAPRMATRRRIDWVLIMACLFALLTVGGGLFMLASLTTPRPLEKPVELTSVEKLAVKYMMDEEPKQVAAGNKKDDGGGIESEKKKDRAPKGARARGAEGAVGHRGEADRTENPEAQQLGGMAEVLSSEVGQEIQKTLGSISSVAEALGGLRSDRIVLGRGIGLGMRGSGSGGGGDAEGVPFGAGSLETGWGGAGKGGGLGGGGTGRGAGAGSGAGEGAAGASERRVAGAGAAKPGQGLPPQTIQRVVMSRMGAFRACYEAAAGQNPNLRGGVTVSFSITPGGTVGAANITHSSLQNARVEGCLLRQFRRLKFPTADLPTNAQYPFVFNPAAK